MRDTFKGKVGRWFVVGGLLLLMGITSVGYVQAAGLSEDEIDWLTYMREEEKLARDVYLYLFGIYGSRIFNNISGSEQTHMGAIKTLLDRYEITDPVGTNDKGVFTNQDLQKLYDALTLQGSASLVEALKVGVFIEETDIDDLTAAIASTRRKDIKTVCSQLPKGSLNHLKAFVSNLSRHGVIAE